MGYAFLVFLEEVAAVRKIQMKERDGATKEYAHLTYRNLERLSNYKRQIMAKDGGSAKINGEIDRLTCPPLPQYMFVPTPTESSSF